MSTPIVIDVPERKPIVIKIEGQEITAWPVKTHIFREKLQMMPQLKALLPGSDGKSKLSRASLMENPDGAESASIAFVWSILQASIGEAADYVRLRERVYGKPNDPNALASCDHISVADIAELPPPSEPVELAHVTDVMSAILEHLHPDWLERIKASAQSDEDQTPSAKKTAAKKS